eukprot:gene35391-47566_t
MRLAQLEIVLAVIRRHMDETGAGIGGDEVAGQERARLGEEPAQRVHRVAGGGAGELALVVDAWARTAGRTLILATVDHGLQTESPAWTERCARFAAKLERPFRALSWTGEKPRTGLPAAARTARHRLLADLAREVGATTLLLGHTADDCLESELMRRDGATTPDPREWAPSPAWPEGRGQFILRPMLGLRRRDLRDWLTQRGETWIDDPSNLNLAYARARVGALHVQIVIKAEAGKVHAIALARPPGRRRQGHPGWAKFTHRETQEAQGCTASQYFWNVSVPLFWQDCGGIDL